MEIVFKAVQTTPLLLGYRFFCLGNEKLVQVNPFGTDFNLYIEISVQKSDQSLKKLFSPSVAVSVVVGR